MSRAMLRIDRRSIDLAVESAQAGGSENRKGERFDRDTARKAFARSFNREDYGSAEWAELIAYFDGECDQAESDEVTP